MYFGGVFRLNKSTIAVCGVILVVFVIMSSLHKESYDHYRDDLIDMRDLLSVCIRAVLAGGKEVVELKDNITIYSKGKTLEGVNDSVTTADKMSHCVMRQLILKWFNMIIISEEENTACEYKEIVEPESLHYYFPERFRHGGFEHWGDMHIYIDPLDATKEYTEKLYEYVTVSACVVLRDEPVIGVIYKPFTKELSYGWVGMSNKIDVKKKPRKDNKTRIVISRSHAGDSLMKELHRKFRNAEVLQQAGAGYKILEVAAGNADAYIHKTHIKKWDVCAGDAILRSLGGRMSTMDGYDINYNATNSKNAVITKGIVATMDNHNFYLNKFET